MMSMIERAARAAGDLQNTSLGGILPAWEDTTDELRAAWCDIARAVMEAIREPSEEMKKAGAFCQPFMTAHGEKPWTPGQIVAHTCYEAMIDAALSEAAKAPAPPPASR